MAAAGTLPGLRPPGVRPTGPLTQTAIPLPARRTVVTGQPPPTGGRGAPTGTTGLRPGSAGGRSNGSASVPVVGPAPNAAGRAVSDRIAHASRPINIPRADSNRNRALVNPYQIPGLNAADRAAGNLADYGTGVMQDADANLMDGFSAPAPVTAQTVNAQAVAANTAAGGAGIDRAVGLLGNTQDSRGMQTDVYGQAMDWASGNMPSVGVDIANEAGVRANEQFLRAGSEANQAYGTSAAGAARAYADSLAAQGYATQRAGVNAARQTGDAASDAVLRQAALTSAARGGNIGMALRAGLGGAAMQSADANRQGARLMSDANAQASAQAAAGQRAAQFAAAQANLATQGTQERAGFAASAAEQAARFQAGQIASAEQQAAFGIAAQQANAAQQGDVAATNAATNLANTGVAVDSMINDVNVGNADRGLAAQTTNAGNALAANTFNAGMILDNNALNSNNWNNVANRGAGSAQFGLGTQVGIGSQASAQATQLVMSQIMQDENTRRMWFEGDEATKDRILQQYAAELGVAVQTRQQNMQLLGAGMSTGGAIIGGALGTVGGGPAGGVAGGVAGGTAGRAAADAVANRGTVSDRRAKKDIKRTAAPDFRKAGSYSYSYKDPKIPGAAPGKQRGPMADELPKEVITKGPDGLMRVDIGRLALQTAAALGELQRKSDAA